MDYENNKHYFDEYPRYVKKIATTISELYDYLKKFYGQVVCYECNPMLLINLMSGIFKWIDKYKNVQ